MKNLKIIISLIIIIVITIIIIDVISKKDNEILVDESFDITFDKKIYSLTQSDKKGLPFKIDCNNKGIEITVDSGVIIGDYNVNDEGNSRYTAKCNTIIYWSPIDNYEENKNDIISIKFYSINHSNIKTYNIHKTEDGNYYITE